MTITYEPSLQAFVAKICVDCGYLEPYYDVSCATCGKPLIPYFDLAAFRKCLQEYLTLYDQQRLALDQDGMISDVFREVPAFAEILIQRSVAYIIHRWIDQIFPTLRKECQQLAQSMPDLTPMCAKIQAICDEWEKILRKTLITMKQFIKPHCVLEDLRKYALLHGKVIVAHQTADHIAKSKTPKHLTNGDQLFTNSAEYLKQLEKLNAQLELDFRTVHKTSEINTIQERYLTTLGELPEKEWNPTIRRTIMEYDTLIPIARALSLMDFRDGMPVNVLVEGGI